MHGRRRLLLVGAVGVVLLAVAGYFVWVRLADPKVEEAVSRLPSSVLRATYTDWAAVAESVPGSELSERSSEEDFDEFLDQAFDKDLTTASALSDSFPAFAANLGITPLDAEWEAYGQSENGAVDVLHLSSEVDLRALEDRFSGLGYDAPADGPGSDGVWAGTPELVAGLDVPLTPVQTNLAVVESERMLLMSDNADYLSNAIDVVKGAADSLASVDGLPELVGTAGSPTVAFLWVGDLACTELAMSQADATDAAEGSSLVEEAGGVHPLDGLVMAQQGDSTLNVGMVFETEEQASADLQPRTDLASGPAPGQGGSFSERFRIIDSVAEGRVVRMQFDPSGGTLLGDLGQGPVLFATC